MSRLAVDDWFYGKPERVRYVAGGGGGYGGSYQTGPQYYSDGDDYYSHRHSGQVVHPSAATSRPMLPDVRLSVPMDSARCVEKVKDTLDISGVYGVHCDVPNQTVTVSGNIAPQALLKRVKQVKRKSKILSYTSLYNNSGHIAPYPGRTTSAYDNNSSRITSHHGHTTSAYDNNSGHIAPHPGRTTSAYDNNSGHIAPHYGRTTSAYDNSGHIAPHHGRTTSAYGAPAYGSSAYNSSYYRSGHMPSPPRDSAYYSRHNQHAFEQPSTGYNNQYHSSHDHHYTNYY